jgi:outer membrane cobalamin receptor
MGGIINVITRSPLNYQGTNINLTASNYGNYKIHASHYSLISNKLGISFSANYLHSDGFYTNLYTNNKVDNLNSYGFRNRLAYKITDKFYIENIFSLENSQQGGYPYSIYDSTLKIASPINYNQYSSYDRLMLSNALNSKYSNQKLEVSNTFSFQYIDDIQKIDQDFTDAKLYFVEQNQIQKMYANELILRSKKNKRYNWLVGGFAFVQKSESGVGVDYYQNVLWYLKSYNTDVKGIAFFHQSNFKITKKLSLTAGLRYDYETSEMHYRYESIKNSLALPIVDTLYPSTKDEIFLPKIAVNYDFEAFSLFISYATGYKAGGFNTTFERPEHLTFKNETSYNYEFGGKTSFLENKIFADFAIFYTQLKNQQIYRTVPSGRGSYLDNAGVSENKGFEFSLQNKAIKGFEIMIAYGYTYSKIVEYVKDETINYNHQFTPYIPRYTFAFQALQTIKLPLKWIDKIKISAVYNRNGELYWDLNNKLKEEPYALLNAKISFVKQNFQLDFWGKNLLNSDYNAFMFEALNKIYTQRNKPLQFGANFAVKF